MSVTIFGVLVVLIGTLLLARGSVTSMLVFVLFSTMLGGSAAINLPALGGSSIPPANLALVFLALRVLLPGPGQMAALGPALSQCGFLILFALYGAAGAMLLPKIFAHVTQVTPLRPGAVRQLFEVAPVHFSSQNITTAVYMLGTLVAGVGSTIAAARPGNAGTYVTVAVAIAVMHALLGFASISNIGALQAVIEFFRNGHYAQLDQTVGGIDRMAGILPEASGFAAYGTAWTIFLVELWLRDVRPRATGPAAMLLGSALLISTSSTAYVAVGGYCAVLLLRVLLMPGTLSSAKLVQVGIALLAGSILTAAVLVFVPALMDAVVHIVRSMTVDKAESWSGQQRLFWAKQGLDAFRASAGFGIGPGSFRSSSLPLAILGSMGVIGAVAFLGHLARAFKPLHASTWRGVTASRYAVGAAASWTSLLMLIPAAVASPSPDPGVVWALFTGLALGLRREPAAFSSPADQRVRLTRLRGAAA